MMIKKILFILITFILLITCLGNVEGADITIEDGINPDILPVDNITDNTTNNITIPNITSFITYESDTYNYTINDSDTLQNVSGEIFYSKDNINNVFIVNVTNDINFTSWCTHLNTFHLDDGQLLINGNGHTINLERGRLDSEYHFAQINNNGMLFVINLTISGFNSPILNRGMSFFSNCTFINNHVKYYIYSGDEAGAIINYGYVYCENCIFENNSGNYAGAIYGDNNGITNLTNCTFNNNINYKSDGGTLYNYDEGQYIINNVNVTKDNKFNVSMAYGSPPGVFTDAIMYIGTYLTYGVSLLLGLYGGVVGCPILFVVLGTIVGTGLHMGMTSLHENLYHEEFEGFTLGEMCGLVFTHFMFSAIGGTIGACMKEHMILKREINGVVKFYKNK